MGVDMLRRVCIAVSVGLVTLLAVGVCSKAATPLPEILRGVGSSETSTMTSLDALAARVLDQGCAQRLLDDRAHSFAEAQVACDAFVSFALVNRTLTAGYRVAPTEVRGVLSRLLDDALSERGVAPFRPGGMREVGERLLPRSVLYRGFVGLMLSGMHRVGALDEDGTELFDALSASLVQDHGSAGLLPSFGAAIWPCDNALAASTLVLHGRFRGDRASAAAGQRLIGRLERLRRRKVGFPTRVAADGRVIEALPRGTALSWTVAFLGMGDRDAAEPFSRDLLNGFCDRRRLQGSVMAACREWPRGVRRGADSASGPVIQGYGVGASALAIAATRVVRSDDWHQALLRAGYRVGLGAIVARPQKYPLENAILHWGRSQRAW